MPQDNVTNASSDSAWRSRNAAVRRARTREKLIFAAARVISEMGEARARIDDFVSAAGISRGTFYNHYATREELLDDLWNHVGSEPFRDIQQATRSIDDPARHLAVEAKLILRRAVSEPVWGWLIYSMSATDKVPQDLLGYPRPDLVVGHRQGRFQFSNMDCANDLVVSAIRRALLGVLQEDRGDAYASGIIELLLRALGLDHAEAHALASLSVEDLVTAT